MIENHDIMNESMNAVTKNIHCLLASKGMFESLCECNEHRESERFEVRSCVGEAQYIVLQYCLLASKGMFESLCECNEHRESERFEVRSCEEETEFLRCVHALEKRHKR